MSDSKEENISRFLGKTIFVADVSPTMYAFKDNLIKELEQHGCIIKTSEHIQNEENEDSEWLEVCDIAVHILSDVDTADERTGKGLESDQIHNSVRYHQHQKILSGTSQSGFEIFAWHPKSGSESIYEEEQVPEHLKKIRHLEEIELLRTNYEDFKFYLLKKLESFTPEVSDEFYIKGSDNHSVYFIYDNVDTDASKEYKDYLSLRGFTVMTPDFGSDILTSRKHHTACLKKFDIALIFALDAGQNWINMKVMDIMKAPGLGREKPILGKAVFAPEQTGAMLQLRNRSIRFCAVDRVFDKKPLEEFLSTLSR